MKKIILLSAALLLLSVKIVSAQKQDSYTCYYFDSDADTTISLNALINDSTVNYLLLAGLESKNRLQNILSAVKYKNNIRKIEIVNYLDNTIPEEIRDFPLLGEVIFSGCPNLKLKKTFKQLSKAGNVSSLVLDDNGSTSIPSTISSLKKLKSVSVTNYDFVNATQLFNNLMMLPELNEVTISSNNEIKLEALTIFPRGLKKLDLSDNGISLLPDDISRISGLSALDISQNNFTDMESTAETVDSLPLRMLSITCLDRKDSLLIVKSMPNTELKVALFHELPKSLIAKKKSKIETAIEKTYPPAIKPAIGNPQIVRKNFTILPEQENKIVYPSGTIITVPQNAFTDSSGKAVTGPVTLAYREYSDIVDVLANGVPMNYDSAGEKLSFRTGGMFEMYAFQNNDLLSLKPGKTISVELASADTTTGYNLYKMDPATGNWNFTTPVNNKMTFRRRMYTNAYKLYPELFQVNIDTASFRDRHDDSLYTRTKKISFSYFKGNKTALTQYLKVKRVYKFTDEKTFKKKANFTFDLKKFNQARELTCYKGYAWVYDGPLSKKEFNYKYISKKKWTDVRVDYNPSENLFTIELKSPHEVVSFEAFPIKPNYKTDLENYETSYLKLDRTYHKSLSKTESRFDRSIHKSIARYQAKVWNHIRTHMNIDERKMTKDEWMTYAKKLLQCDKDSLNNIQTSQYTITRSFQIDGFGIWNCDQIMRYKNPVQITAEFKDIYDKKLKPTMVYVIDNKLQGIFSYGFSGGSSTIIMDPNSESAIFIVLSENSIALVDKNNVKTTLYGGQTGKKYSFTAYEINPAVVTTSELRKKLGFE